MKKNIIDKWFSIPSNMKRLDEYTSKALNKYNKSIKDKYELISNAYLYILIKDIDPTKGNIESLCKGYIKFEIFKYNSSFNRTKRGQIDFNNTLDFNEVFYLNDYSNNNTIYDIYDIDNILEEFISNLSLHEKGVWNIFYTRCFNNCRSIMKHMNISMNGASIILNEGKALELKLREMIKIKIKDEN